MIPFRLTPKRTSILLSFAFVFIIIISAINNSIIQDSSWLTELVSEVGDKEGDGVESRILHQVVQIMPEDKPMLKIVHLDLKGAPPKLSYLRHLLPLLAKAGCNALLVEYEDMFPYHGILKNISAKNAYSQQQVMNFLSWCHDLGMEVIPLVQTFGHLEFVLKLEEFRYLREVDEFPQEICPSNSNSLSVIQEMLRQVLSIHRTAKYIHIGCDEVYHLAMCNLCVKRQIDSREIFVSHVKSVAEFLKLSYPGITPLIWDDMMRSWSPQFLSSTPLGNLVEPVVWVYTDNIERLVPHYIWYWYTRTFTNIWIAGAFKGATTSTSVLPDMRNHFENQKSWLRFISKSTKSARGYVLTGWSRYDHFASLCELLPPSVPSLLLNLIFISSKKSEADEKIFKKWRELMKCSPSVDLTFDSETPESRALAMCSFGGMDAYALMNNYLTLKNRVDWLHTYLTERDGWMTPYNVKYNFTSPMRILDSFKSKNGENILKEVEIIRNETVKILSNYYDIFTVQEWIEQRLEPLQTKMNALTTQIEILNNIRTWPRRPLTLR
ncbi:hexosaminidase D-like [Lycorma delicatula]|uniref:hexosaminidase D-like n=1 Tax=Lycorma delicatula TaxID=130591 RepID=UPI003F5161F8